MGFRFLVLTVEHSAALGLNRGRVTLYSGKACAGLAPNTIRRQVAAISSVLTCGSSTVSRQPVTHHFLRGASNLRPPTVHRFPTWDLNKVLSTLTVSPFEPLRLMSLRFLSFKTAFLVAITSA